MSGARAPAVPDPQPGELSGSTGALAAIGLGSLLGQVALLRELQVASYGNELVLLLGLGAWLAASALGAAAGRRMHLPAGGRVVAGLLLLATLVPAALLLARGLRPLLGGVRGGFLPLGLQLVGIAVVLGPPAVAAGLLFRWAAKRAAAHGRTLAAAYAIESAGALAGGLLATGMIAAGARNTAAALLASVACCASALHASWPRRRAVSAVAASAALAAILLLPYAASIDRWSTAWTHPDLLAVDDTPYGRFTLEQRGEQVVLYLNDALVFESQGTAAEEFVHLAALQHESPRRVLVLGGTVEGLARELLVHDPTGVDLVELDRALLRAVRPHLPAEDRVALADPRVRIVHEDPRRFLRAGRPYDLILVAMPEPDSGLTNRFYTAEFFELCTRRLAPAGVLAFQLPAAGNVWTGWETQRAASIHRAVREALPHVVALPGTRLTVVASPAPLPAGPAPLVARLEQRGLTPRLVVPPYLRYLYTSDRFDELDREILASPAPVNRDARPICYTYTLLIWLSQFLPHLAGSGAAAPAWLGWSTPTWGLLLLGALAVGVAAAGRAKALRGPLTVGVVGCAGMVLQTVLLLWYQTSRGVLFQDLGVLLTAFMAGLVVGARWADRLAAGTGDEGASTTGLTVSLLTGIAALAIVLALLLRAGAPLTLVSAAIVLLLAGTLVAGVLGAVSLHRRQAQVPIVGSLYAADLAGGAIGAVAASLLLVPVFGLAWTLLATAPLALAAIAGQELVRR